MSNTSITYFVGACAGVFSFTAYVAFVAVPAWNAYSRVWQRVAAVFMSIYVLAAMVGVGILVGALITLNWDQVG
ncbi:MAG TPA: hypothetical protein VGN78_15940 [Solirubrobacteraceae bacterium]|jgi:hypothetical protein|nr:hypothetical protein [Solirubrobacteraceae bacterium]